MKTIGQVLKLACQYLESKNASQGRLEAEHLIANTLGLKRLDLYLRFDAPLTENELESIRVRLTRLAKGEPLAYIEGTVSFYNVELNVDRRVLIPRPETELLVEAVLKRLQGSDLQGKQLWDICTGSGCIGLAIKKALPDLSVTLSDLSSDALIVANENAKRNALAVKCVEGDLLAPFQAQKADFVVCNPPYIAMSDFQKLDSHVRDFEPKGALTSGSTGFEIYERLSSELPSVLNPGAIVWLEIGAGQAEMLRALFSGAGFTDINTYRDYGQHERILELHFTKV